MAALLGVNIDHVATLRQARGTTYPDPVEAALICEQAGAEGITLHLREDRRHIQDDDVRRMRPLLKTRMNLELAVTDEMVEFAKEIQPQHVCFVPEKRQEVTTEGGLDVVANFEKVKAATQALAVLGCDVSLLLMQILLKLMRQLHVEHLRLSCIQVPMQMRKQNKSNRRTSTYRKRCRIRGSKRFSGKCGHGLNLKNIAPLQRFHKFMS